MLVRCPHCRDPFQLSGSESFQELSCPSCGSLFSLVAPSDTISYSAPHKRVAHFELCETVGAGRFGCVYRARDESLDRTVAVKVPRSGCLTPEETEMFLREARAAGQLRHANIVAVHEVGRDGSSLYIVSDYIPGASLKEWLAVHRPSVREAASLCLQIAQGLHHAHEMGVIHRDLKPGNVLMDVGDRPLIADFGLAKRELGEVTITCDGQILGTPAYMSPEQAKGQSHAVDRRSDIYSLGVILFELLTGELPFRGDHRMLLVQTIRDEPPSPRKLNGHISRDLATICLKCLEKSPDRRYATAQQLADDLQRFLDDKPVMARPVGRIVKFGRWTKRQPALASAAGIGLVSLLAAAAAALSFAIYQQAVNSNLKREQQQTKQALDVAQRERERADDEYHRTQLISAGLALDRGLELCEAGKVADGLLWLARGLELAPVNARDLQRVIRTNIAGWSRHIHPLELAIPHPDKLYDVAVHRDGKVVATACEDGVVRFYDIVSGEFAATSLIHSSPVWAIQFSPDGNWLATGAADGKVRRWNWRTGSLLEPIDEHQDKVSAVAFSPDGKWLASGSTDRTAHLISIEDPQQPPIVIAHDEMVQAVAFDPSGKNLITGGDDPGTSATTLRFWEVATGKAVGDGVKFHTTYAMAVNPKTDQLLIGTTAFEATLWSLKTRKQQARFVSHQSWVFDVAISPNHRLAATASRDGTAQIWDLDTRRPLGARLTHSAAVRGCAFALDGSALVTCGEDNTLRRWRLTVDPFCGPSHVALHYVNAVSVSGDGSYVLSASGDQTAVLWEARTGKQRIRADHGNWVAAAAISPDGKTIATAGVDGKVRFFNAQNGESRPLELQHPWPLHAIRFSPDGRSLLTGCGDFRQGDARLWSLSSGSLLAPPMEHRQRVLAVAFSPDGMRAATASEDQTVRLWDISQGATAVTSLQHQNAVHAVAFHPDGNRLLTADWNGAARFWDIRKALQQGHVFKHDKPVLDAALSRDGSLLLTGSYDGSARLWDSATGKRLHPPFVQAFPIESVDISPSDPRVCITGGQDLTTRVWTLPSPVDGSAARLAAWIESITGMRLDQAAEIRLMDGVLWKESRDELKQLGGAPRIVFPPQFTGDVVPAGVAAYHRGAAAFTKNQDDVALEELNAAVAEGSQRAFYVRGRLHYRLKDYAAAADDFSRAESAGVRDEDLRYYRGSSYFALKRWAEAKIDLKRVQAVSPNNPAVQRLLAHSCASLGQWDEAVALYDQLTDIDSAAAMDWCGRAIAHLAAGDVEQYEAICQEFWRRFGSTTDRVNQSLLLKLLVTSNAIDDTKKLVELAELFRQEPVGRLRYAAALYRDGQYSQAQQEFDAIVKDPTNKVPLNAWNWCFYAMTVNSLGHVDEARQALEKAVAWRREAEMKGQPLDWMASAEMDKLYQEAIGQIK